MANPIIPSGQRIIRQIGELDDPVERARRQDEERRIREDDEYFRRTGENRSPITEHSPLVEDNPREDVANDGDSYDETISHYQRPNGHTIDGDWAEDNPTQIIGGNRTNRHNSSNRSEMEAYLGREQEKKANEQKTLENKNRKKYNNAICGLETDHDL